MWSVFLYTGTWWESVRRRGGRRADECVRRPERFSFGPGGGARVVGRWRPTTTEQRGKTTAVPRINQIQVFVKSEEK